MKIVVTERLRETLRFLRDIGVGVIAILGSVWTVYAAWDEFKELGIAIILFLALIFAVWFYYHRKIRSAPYLKAGAEAEVEAVKLLRATNESLYYYGGVSFISASKEWHDEYVKKLESETTIMRFLDTISLDEMRELLKQAMPIEDIEPLLDEYRTWTTTHCDNLKKRIQHNCFFDFKGAPIWRYGLHCIIFDRKHIVLPFASGESRKAVFIPNCPEIANALAHCFEWLVTDFGLESMNDERLATRVGLSQTSVEKE